MSMQRPPPEVPGIRAKSADHFYTGKPYDHDQGEYLFKYRGYNPETNRWRTPDPSGFPDGANNSIYAPTPTFMLDPLGLEIYKQFFGYHWSTVITSITETSTTINLTGVSVGLGIGATGPTGALNFDFTISTSSEIISSFKVTELLNEDIKDRPQGEDWVRTGRVVVTSEQVSTSKIENMTEIEEDRYRSKWHTQTVIIGYIEWEE